MQPHLLALECGMVPPSLICRYNGGRGLRRRISQLARGDAALAFARLLPQQAPLWASLSQVDKINAAKEGDQKRSQIYYQQQYELASFYFDATQSDDLRAAGGKQCTKVLYSKLFNAFSAYRHR
jgi:hypothetical protein